MPSFPFTFKSILLHTLPDKGGWDVYGLPHQKADEQVAQVKLEEGSK